MSQLLDTQYANVSLTHWREDVVGNLFSQVIFFCCYGW